MDKIINGKAKKERMIEWMDGWMDGWMDEKMNADQLKD